VQCCVRTDCAEFTGKEKQGKITRDFKVTTAVNNKITLLRIVTPFILVQGTKVSETSSGFTFKIP